MKIWVSQNTVLTDYNVDLTEIDCEPADSFLFMIKFHLALSKTINWGFICYHNMSKN